MKKHFKIAFLGCGNIGCGVWNLLNGFSADIEHRAGVSFEICRVLVRDVNKQRTADVPKEILTTQFRDIVDDPEIDIVLEFLGGEEPAHRMVVETLKAGKTVVTANKVAFALHWHEMQKIAMQNNAGLYYEAAVCGAIPIIHVLEESLQANRIDSVCGIVNGTTNYILSRMSREGAEYADVLADAQRLGLAEPDPTADVEGFDAAYKLSILSSLAFHGRVPFENIYREGITKVQAEDIRICAGLGYTLKLLAIARRRELTVETRVHPALIPNDHPLANVSGAHNAVFLHGHACGDMMFMGNGAGDFPTAGALVSDLVRAATSENHLYPSFLNSEIPADPFIREDNWECSFYARLIVADRPGMLVELSLPFARHGVSLKILQQSTHSQSGKAELILVTHQTREQDFQAALKEIPQEIAGVESILRLEIV